MQKEPCLHIRVGHSGLHGCLPCSVFVIIIFFLTWAPYHAIRTRFLWCYTGDEEHCLVKYNRSCSSKPPFLSVQRILKGQERGLGCLKQTHRIIFKSILKTIFKSKPQKLLQTILRVCDLMYENIVTISDLVWVNFQPWWFLWTYSKQWNLSQ